MNKTERWLFTVAFCLAFTPLIAVGMVYRMLPAGNIIVEVLTNVIIINKANDLSIGFFCLIPLAMTTGAAILKYFKFIDHNFFFINIGSILISGVFLGITVWCLAHQLSMVELLRKIDYTAAVCSLASMAIAVISTLLYFVKPNEYVGLRNRHTRKNDEIWYGVHKICSFTGNAVFASLALIIVFFRWYVAVTALIATLLFAVFGIVNVVSHFYAESHAKKKAAAEKEEISR